MLDEPIACLEGAYCPNHEVDHITNQIKLNKINNKGMHFKYLQGSVVTV